MVITRGAGRTFSGAAQIADDLLAFERNPHDFGGSNNFA
jgi:hypothetical protein